jgi:hypothetical protein
MALWITSRFHPEGGQSGKEYYVVFEMTDGPWMVFVGPDHPRRYTREPYFYMNGNKAYRSWGHPDGPSSIPFYWIRGSKVYPDEGYPSGRSDLPHFDSRRLAPRRNRIGATRS